MKAVLALDDGAVFIGTGFGDMKDTAGEVVFNTSLVGYEESLTDPSYRGQMLCLTYPLIGNYGVRSERFESNSIQVKAFIIRELCTGYSHRGAVKSIDRFLKEYSIPGIQGIDTRMLAKKLRNHGVMNGALAFGEDVNPEDVIARAKGIRNYSSLDLVSEVSVDAPVTHNPEGKKKLALLDTGVKLSIIRSFTRRGISVIQFPYGSTPEEIMRHDPGMLFCANGPGDPKRAEKTIDTIRMLSDKIPVSGICFGNQLISLAFGAKTYKLKFGHRGINQPVKELKTGKVSITSQNHGFAVDEKSLKGTGLSATHINLNDGSVEGVRHKALPIMCVQFHPEANPGPWDTDRFFDDVVEMIR